MTPTPANKESELVDAIQRITDLRHPPELEMRRIQRDAMALVRSHVEPASGHMVAGIVDCLRFNAEEFQRHFDIAFSLSPSRHIRKNYLYGAMRLGFVKKPLSCAQELISSYPDDLEMLGSVQD